MLLLRWVLFFDSKSGSMGTLVYPYSPNYVYDLEAPLFVQCALLLLLLLLSAPSLVVLHSRPCCSLRPSTLIFGCLVPTVFSISLWLLWSGAAELVSTCWCWLVWVSECVYRSCTTSLLWSSLREHAATASQPLTNYFWAAACWIGCYSHTVAVCSGSSTLPSVFSRPFFRHLL